MDLVLLGMLLVTTLWVMPVMVVVVPPLVMLDGRGWSLTAGWLWLAAVVLVIGYGTALSADMDHADATGGSGSLLAGSEWLGAAVLAATASLLVARRRPVARSETSSR